VKPHAGYTRNPYDANVEGGRLYGLGSNDAGGALMALLGAFRYLVARPLPINVIFVASAEEEISGAGGIASVLPLLPPIDLALVGEPTLMRAAVAEKGLLVIDCEVRGKAGHAARSEGENALYKALADIAWFRDFRFPKVSPTLGRVRMAVTLIEAGRQHNVVPDLCRFTVDIRVTDAYTHEEVLAIIRAHVGAVVIPRSMHLRASATPDAHPVLAALEALGIEAYGSPTLSDQAQMPFPSLKMGPGDSARSHMADEYIYVEEIGKGIEGYLTLLQKTYV
jgi:acetylornithine deacetylase